MTYEELDRLGKLFHDAFRRHRVLAPPWSDLAEEHKLGILEGLKAVLKELDPPVCPRCHQHPIDKGLLGKEGEGHICGWCWISDRSEEESWLMS